MDTKFLQYSPGKNWRNGQRKVVNVFIKDLDENNGFISIDKTRLRDSNHQIQNYLSRLK